LQDKWPEFSSENAEIWRKKIATIPEISNFTQGITFFGAHCSIISSFIAIPLTTKYVTFDLEISNGHFTLKSFGNIGPGRRVPKR